MLTLPGAFDAIPNPDCLAVTVGHSVPFPNTFVCVVMKMGHDGKVRRERTSDCTV